MTTNQANLFDGDATPMPLIFVDHRETVARQKIGILPASWRVFKWQSVGTDAVMMTGSETTKITKGLRKGRDRWIGESKVAVVTDYEVCAEIARYETDTSFCAECCGNKVVPFIWDAQGAKYRECHKCSGTGCAKDARLGANHVAK